MLNFQDSQTSPYLHTPLCYIINSFHVFLQYNIKTPYPVLCFYFVIFKKRQNRHLPELAFLNPRAFYTPILFFYHFMNYFPRLSLFYLPTSQEVS